MLRAVIRLSINVVENRAREILLLRRSPQAHLGAGLWGFPAGRIEGGETPSQCALRELTEEIGAEHRIELISTFGPIRDTFYGGIFKVYLFHHRWLEGRIVLNHEHTQYAWVGREIYKRYSVMNGIDEDLAYLNVWPHRFLNHDKLPPR
ncbi:MAG: NUDIX hydrolase [Gammaproteobacteria bacterium]